MAKDTVLNFKALHAAIRSWGPQMKLSEAYKTGYKHGFEDKAASRENRAEWFTAEDDYAQGYRDGWKAGREKY